MADETGQRVGDYEVLAKLGAGGMGRVYKVRNVISNREEAMKILLPDFASDPDLAARFMAEIRTLAGLEHPGIAQLRTAFQVQNQFVMVMEYVEGTTLEKLASQIRIPLDHVLDYAGQVLAALSYAHSRGVIHRDMKPANVMITTHGLVKLMDFGIAKSTNDMQLTRPGTTMGSVYYMSPEQVRGGTIDARSDIYSFGVTLYELLTGRKPFQADTSYTVLNAQLNDPPTPLIEVNPSIPPALSDIVLRAMAKRPEERFQTADDFRAALRAVHETAAAEPLPATPIAAVMASSAPSQPAPTPVPSAYFPAPAFAHAPTVVMPPQPAAGAGERASAPAYTPVPPVAVPPPSASRNRRGLWIAMGAAAAILALIAVATVLPRVFSTHASPQLTNQNTAQNPTPNPTPAPPDSQPQPKPDSQPQNPTEVAAQPDAKPNPTHPAKDDTPRRGHDGHDNPDSANSNPSSNRPDTQPAANQPPQPSAQEIRQAHDRYMNLDARAQAALEGVQQIRSQQQSQGLDMRGDILASTNRVRNLMTEANSALSRNDLEAANDYLERADREVAALEKFLGR